MTCLTCQRPAADCDCETGPVVAPVAPSAAPILSLEEIRGRAEIRLKAARQAEKNVVEAIISGGSIVPVSATIEVERLLSSALDQMALLDAYERMVQDRDDWQTIAASAVPDLRDTVRRAVAAEARAERLSEALAKAEAVIELAGDALGVADGLIERGYGTDTPSDWNEAFLAVMEANEARSVLRHPEGLGNRGSVAAEPLPVAMASEPATPSEGDMGIPISESVGDVLADLVPRGHRCGPFEATDEQFSRLTAAIDRANAAQAERMPDEKAALDQMFDAFDRLRKLGWNEAIYCPKDGTAFEAIEAGSTGIFDCHYSGKWPDGSWWAEDGGDLWPSRPVLFRLKASQSPRPSSREGEADRTHHSQPGDATPSGEGK